MEKRGFGVQKRTVKKKKRQFLKGLRDYLTSDSYMYAPLIPAIQTSSAAPIVRSSPKGKSSVLLDVKPWDDETDMQMLEETVRSVQMDGLLWGASKRVPIGYGIKKLRIMMTIVNELVSMESLIEEHLTAEPANKYIQSCEVVDFNKI